MKKTIFGITGKVFYVIATDYSTGYFYFWEDLMPDDIIGQRLEVAPPIKEITISNEKDFIDFLDFCSMQSDFRTFSITEEIPERFLNEEWTPGLFIGNFDVGEDKELQKEILENIKLKGYN